MNVILVCVLLIIFLAIIITGLIILVVIKQLKRDNYEDLEFSKTKEFIIDEDNNLDKVEEIN